MKQDIETTREIETKIEGNVAHIALRSSSRRRKVLFRYYAERAAYGSKDRAKNAKVPHAIDADFIERLLEDQKWRCAISRIELAPRPSDRRGKGNMDALGPSLDRIIPAKGYVPGNVRVVCNIVNVAMGQWGLATLKQVIKAIQQAPRKA